MAKWKMHYEGKTIYCDNDSRALKSYWFLRDRFPFEAYYLDDDVWQFVVRRRPSTQCECGRDYDDAPDKKPFIFQHRPEIVTLESAIQTMRSPGLCIVCYYSNELNEGRWAPKFVKRKLGLET
jgi:hypothetical protein